MNKKSKYPEGLSEVKDSRGDNQIRIVRMGHITYKSTEGYKNKMDMRKAATNDAIEIIEEYALLLTIDQIERILRAMKTQMV